MDEPTATPVPTPWTLSYRPGDWTVLAVPAAIVVLEPAPARAAAMVGEVWRRVQGAQSASDLTARLTAIGLDAMPSLGVVFRDAAGLHALLRGRITLLDDRGERLTDGPDAGTWRTVDVPGESCTVRLDEPDPGLPTLPLSAGVVRAAEVVVDTVPRDVPRPVSLYPVEPSTGAEPTLPVVPPDAEPEPTPAPEPTPGTPGPDTEPEYTPSAELDVHPLDGSGPVVDEVLHPGPMMWAGSDEPPAEVRTAAHEWDDADDGPATLPDNRAALGQDAAPVERPPARLRLVTSFGQVVDVDRTVIIGRAPVAPAADPDATLLTVPSPSHDISRVHVRVTPGTQGLEVTDLHSTNGTILVAPGGSAVRLAPGQGVPLEAGSTLDLGDGLTIEVITFRPV